MRPENPPRSATEINLMTFDPHAETTGVGIQPNMPLEPRADGTLTLEKRSNVMDFIGGP